MRMPKRNRRIDRLGLINIDVHLYVYLKVQNVKYNSSISACEKGGKWEKALELLEEMKRAGLSPNLLDHD